MTRIKILCPDMISGNKGDEVVLYKNEKELYIAILNGIEIGLAKEIETNSPLEKIETLPSCLKGTIEKSFTNRFTFSILI